MIYIASETAYVPFVVNSATGAATNADALPTAVLVRNGAVDGAVTVTITNLSAGAYLASFAVPSGYSAGDELVVLVSATIATIAAKRFVGHGKVDVLASTVAALADTAATQATAANGKLTSAFTNMVTRWNTMVEQIGTSGLYRFVAGALSQAPTGSSGGSGGYQVRPGMLSVVLADGVAAINEIILNQGEVTWVESRVVDEEGVAVSLDGATLGIVLTGPGGFSQELEPEQVEKVLDADDINIDGRFRWLATNALGELTGQVRRNVRLTLTLDRGATSKRSALARVQVVA